SRSSASNSPENVAASLQSAVDGGRLVTLSSDDAYTYFFRLRNLEPQEKILSEIKPKVLPQLRRLGDEVFGKRVSMGLEVLTERDWTIALRAYEWAHVLEEGDKAIEARWKYAEGRVAEAQNRRDDAQNSFYAATQLDSSWALPVNDLGYLYVLNRRYSEAIPYYQRAISLQPGWDIPYNNMGTANYYLKNYEAAEMWYRKAIEVNANWATPHVWLGSIYENRGLKSTAIEEYQTTLNLYNPNRDRINTVEIQNKINALRGY
ncbi:MAG: tetratricopeptide repeat protein, partial [Pyrinomonadaceae bacterium]